MPDALQKWETTPIAGALGASKAAWASPRPGGAKGAAKSTYAPVAVLEYDRDLDGLLELVATAVVLPDDAFDGDDGFDAYAAAGGAYSGNVGAAAYDDAYPRPGRTLPPSPRTLRVGRRGVAATTDSPHRSPRRRRRDPSLWHTPRRYSDDDGAPASTKADDLSTSPLFPTSPRPDYDAAAAERDPAPAWTPGAPAVDDDDDLF